ncbi:Hypothetical predicted protein [Mytilus galloprovincialis]|uniref:Uncharacterized protein n=1 Tax=Mytilus galloprovincialis TaxID=29158 RepID=A0A8B6ESV7_MYTGA|nr:Hypothetical predicted protein [Mytilus galloprovincialis]
MLTTRRSIHRNENVRASEHKKDYQIQFKIPGLPAHGKEIPDDERFSFDYQSPVTIETVLVCIANRIKLLESMTITKVLSEKGT